MVIQQLEQQKKFNVGLNTDEIIRVLKRELEFYFSDLITIEEENSIINICWFSDEEVLNKQLKEQEILKNIFGYEALILIWNKIKNYNLNTQIKGGL